ncbi:ABC transporter ATP-binding protein [Rubellicoccus peritrichatus]|uniref:ABC transporter ATP-binding protein n=1 Tax=Rubellicoccus peritrichatus TaxID=3080537 RepID=A0AAQ3QUK4_9BACT|nr:ABC transporter ATP-binding protein [Puniceicoccus sp. CR14]WOO40020.1 ABC transporter ATP-binding protein [Puniceicoccus sp. CR14]
MLDSRSLSLAAEANAKKDEFPHLDFLLRIARDMWFHDLQSLKAIIPYLSYLKPHRKLFLLGTALSILFGLSSGLGIPVIVETLMKDVLENREQIKTIWPIVGIGAITVGIFVVRGLAGFFGGYLLSSVGMAISVRLRQDLFEKMQALPLAYFEKNKTGDLLTKVNNDANAIQTMIIEVAGESIRQPATMIAAIGTLIYMSITNGEFFYLLLFLLTVPILVIPVKLIGRHLKKRGRQLQDSHAEVMQHLNENLDALQEVRSFSLEEPQQREFNNRLETNKTIQLKLKKYELSQQPSMEIIISIAIVAVFVFAFQAGIEFSIFAKLAVLLYFTFDPLKRIMKMVNLVNKTEGSLHRVEEIMDMPLPMVDPPDPKPLDVANGEIAFKDVNFAYDEEPVLRKMTVALDAGKSVALVGPSGAGKSTFAKLVPRFYDTSDGVISIDGTDVRDVRQADLRRNIAVVSQHPVLFDASIMDNIRIGKPDASREEVEEAAKRAFAHDFIERFDDGYETICGERGDRLSGGQKQRIALARAFLKDAPILILDEATSALDSESERFIQKALADLMHGKTVLIIAHRYSTIQHADRILVFEKGQIAEDGSHDELHEANGLYRRLYEQQKF